MDANWSGCDSYEKSTGEGRATEAAMYGVQIGLLVLAAGVILCALVGLLRSATKKASVVPLASSVAAELGLTFASGYIAGWSIWEMHATEHASAHNLRFLLCVVLVRYILMLVRPVGLLVYASVETFDIFKRKDVGLIFAMVATGLGTFMVVGLAVPNALSLTVGHMEICPGKTMASLVPTDIGRKWVLKYREVLLLVSYVLTVLILGILAGLWLFFHLSGRGGDRGETKSLMGQEGGKALSTYACPAICLVAIVRSIVDIGFVSDGFARQFEYSSYTLHLAEGIVDSFFLPGTACVVLLAFMVCKK